MYGRAILHADPCLTWLKQGLGQMSLRGRPFEKILFFSKILQPHLLSRSRAVRSDWLWHHIDVVTMVTHHQRCSAYWSAYNAAGEEPGSNWGLKDQKLRPQAENWGYRPRSSPQAELRPEGPKTKAAGQYYNNDQADRERSEDRERSDLSTLFAT